MGSSTENSAFGADAQPVGRSIGFPAARAADPRPRSPPAWCRSRSAPTPADRSASPRRSAASSGFKPTYGRVSRYGLHRVRVVARSDRPVRHDGRRRGAGLQRHRRTRPARRDVVGRGRCPTTPRRSTSDVARACASACRARCSSEGVDAERPGGVRRGARGARASAARRSSTIELPHAAHAIPVYYLVATAEASSNLARYDGVRYGYARPRARTTRSREMYERTRGDGLRRRGEAPHHARHLRAERRLLRRVLPEGAAGAHADSAATTSAAFEQVDVVAMPTSPTGAFRLGERTVGSAADVPGRRLHGRREPGGAAGDQRAVRVHRRERCRSACSSPARDGRGDAAAGGGGVPARDRLARAAAVGAARRLLLDR